MSVSGVRDGLKTRLGTISGLYIHDTAPGAINQTPAALIIPARGEYGSTLTGGITHTFTVVLMVSVAQGWALAQDQLDGYLSDTGASSIKAAIEAIGTLPDGASRARVGSYENYGGREYPPESGQNFLGVDFPVVVME
jgi:hypothetical protein